MPVQHIKVTKGKLTAFRGNKEVVTRQFMFNPNDVDDSKGINWGSIDIPGASHPIVAFGSGGARTINFQLYIDGDRGRAGERKGSGVFDVDTQRFDGSGVPLDISDELYWYRSLIYPNQYGSNAEAVFPFIVLFSMGPLYRRLECVVTKADWKVNYWTPRMEPVRATVSLGLQETVNKSQVVEDIWKLGRIGGR